MGCLHYAKHDSFSFFDAVGIGLWWEFIVEEMFEDLALDIFQGLGHSRKPLGDAPFQTDLRVYLKP